MPTLRSLRARCLRVSLVAVMAVGLVLAGGACADRGDRASAEGALPTFADAAPGAEASPPALVKQLEAAWRARDSSYVPRTRHLHPDGTPRYTNRLFLESSPYLRQHAHNPVNWYPWGDEAFDTARRLHRPVLLSVGYSTCHWCHVMEEESFEDEEVARVLNEKYVAIKVDREERPDVDAIYMTAVQAMTGRGGWPMTVWLTPDREPFYGGTYFPARDGDRGASVGFLGLLGKVRQAYDEQPEQVVASAGQLTAIIRQGLEQSSAGDSLPGLAALDAAFEHYAGRFDAKEGGLDRAPKFPSSLPVRFLLRVHSRTGDPRALAMARLSLQKMADGGLHDQVGGGFHRYSTDAQWLVPHFEKMLYDNALLAVAYLEGFQATGDSAFARVVRSTLRYVERDMTSPEGAFYSATDADSRTPEGRREEGWFFTWTPAELQAVLGPKRAASVATAFGVVEGGNFEGRSILHRVGPAGPRQDWDRAREELYVARARRPAPLRDEKILAAWNGLMISAYARAALALGEPAYARSAARAADFVLTHMRHGNELRRSFKDGQARLPGHLDDHAFMIAGLLDLYEASGDRRWLKEAMSLDAVLAARFEDPEDGGFFMTGRGQESLLARHKPASDGAEPSGNSVQALNLLRLAALTTDDRYRVRGERTILAFARVVRESPAALAEMLLAVDFQRAAVPEILIVTPGDRAGAEPFLAALRATYVPNRIVVVAREGADLEGQAALVPLLEDKVAQGGRTTAYLCERGLCKLPTSDPTAFARQLRGIAPARGRP